jgi:inosine-uridine nucleoside N-ribohydrolase
VAQGIFTHDPSAVGYVLHPAMFRVLRGQVRVATEGVARGQTILRPTGSFARATDFDGRPEVAVCVGVDSAAFLDFYRDTLVRKQG